MTAKRTGRAKTAQATGHARLQAALVLRDALARELGLDLDRAMRALADVENTAGAAAGLTEGRYLAVLAAVCEGNLQTLTGLHDDISRACGLARFSPRYAQYLALLLFAHWARARQEDPAAFLVRLNEHWQSHPAKGAGVPAFTEADLQLAAFWMATAAGKTHLLHACLALLERRTAWNQMIIITPTEALTRQHAAKLRALAAWNVFAYPLDGDAFALGRQPPDTIIVLDINKLAVEKKGDGVTIPVSVFAESRNLVCVDEGHKGQKSEASVWKAIQTTLAGIDPGTPHAQRGLLIEFSATFGQVVDKEPSFGRYAKAVVFDYAYDRFHRDRYGKDFWHARLQASQDAKAAAYRQTLTAALLTYWHQVSCYRTLEGQPAAARHHLRIEAPLWVLLGLSVIGGSANQGDKEQTSDVVNVLAWLAEALSFPDQLAGSLRQVLAAPALGQADSATLLPSAVRQRAAGMDSQTLATRVLAECFGWQPGGQPVLRLIRSAPGELGLGLLRGDTLRYFGVVNVGDAPGLKKALEEKGLPVEEEALHGSLFAGLDHPGSPLNVLIGSRRFAEGWDNYRASSLTLLRLGQSEGSLIIQMFGRVVRFAGTSGDGKRLAAPPPVLEPLQTAYVYGLKSGYLQTFLNGLMQHGVPLTRRITCNFDRRASADLRIVRNDSPALTEFQVAAQGGQWLNNIRPLSLNLTASIAAARLVDGQVIASAGLLGEDITAGFKRWLPLLDGEAVYRDLLEWRRARGYWNFRFDRTAIEAALRSDRYQILGLPDTLQVRQTDDIDRLQRLATAIVRQLFERTYRQQQPSAPVLAPLAVEPKQYSREEPDVQPNVQ